MDRYIVTVREITENSFVVEAETEQEAIDKANAAVILEGCDGDYFEVSVRKS